MPVNEKQLNKGHLRKLGALRKSLGKKIADRAFAEWQKEQTAAKPVAKSDAVAKKLKAALKSLEKDKSVNLGRHGYSVRRAKGKGAKGFVVERIQGAPKARAKEKAAAAKNGRKSAAKKRSK